MDPLAFGALFAIPFFLGAKRQRFTRPIWHCAAGILLVVVPTAIECALIRLKVERPQWLVLGFIIPCGIAMLGYTLGLNASYKEWKRATEQR